MHPFTTFASRPALAALALFSTLAVGALAPAQAQTIQISASNAGAPELYAGFPAYRVDFRIEGPGVYSFETLTAGFDTFIELYPGTAATPLASFDPIAFDDDGSATACGDFYCSLIVNLALPAGDYALFVRGASGETGSFELALQTIQGAPIMPVPEPAAWLLLAAGLLALRGWQRAAQGR